jgi:Protein of unknown function (DUF732)
MFAHRVTKIAATAVTGAALGLAALASAGTASALTSADNAFLTTIASAGIGYDDATAAVSNAHAVCKAMDSGYAPEDIAIELMSLNQLSVKQAATIVVASVEAYCPSHTAQLA